MNRNLRLVNGDDLRDHRNEQAENNNSNKQPVINENTFNASPVAITKGDIKRDKLIFNDTEFYCRKCNSRVWINNDTVENIRNRFLCINYKAKYGLCRYCFISVKDLEYLFEGVDDVRE